MAEIKKFLDQKGVEHLWSRISMEDYPNNDTLMAVINAIDETKADKSYVNEVISKLATEDFVSESIDNIEIPDVSGFETQIDALIKLNDAKEYADTAIAALVNSAPETLDTLGELATAFQENDEIIDVLNQAITTKYSADNPPPYPVISVNGKTGAVVLPSETWTFTLSNGSTVTKKVVIAQ